MDKRFDPDFCYDLLILRSFGQRFFNSCRNTRGTENTTRRISDYLTEGDWGEVLPGPDKESNQKLTGYVAFMLRRSQTTSRRIQLWSTWTTRDTKTDNPGSRS